MGRKKLTDAQVELIRKRGRKEFYGDLAEEYGVDQSTISLIVNKKRRYKEGK